MTECAFKTQNTDINKADAILGRFHSIALDFPSTENSRKKEFQGELGNRLADKTQTVRILVS